VKGEVATGCAMATPPTLTLPHKGGGNFFDLVKRLTEQGIPPESCQTGKLAGLPRQTRLFLTYFRSAERSSLM